MTDWCKHGDMQPCGIHIIDACKLYMRDYWEPWYLLDVNVLAMFPNHNMAVTVVFHCIYQKRCWMYKWCIWRALRHTAKNKSTRGSTHIHIHSQIKWKGIYLYFLNLDDSQNQWPRAWDTRGFWIRVGRQNPPSSHKTPFTTSGELRST